MRFSCQEKRGNRSAPAWSRLDRHGASVGELRYVGKTDDVWKYGRSEDTEEHDLVQKHALRRGSHNNTRRPRLHTDRPEGSRISTLQPPFHRTGKRYATERRAPEPRRHGDEAAGPTPLGRPSSSFPLLNLFRDEQNSPFQGRTELSSGRFSDEYDTGPRRDRTSMYVRSGSHDVKSETPPTLATRNLHSPDGRIGMFPRDHFLPGKNSRGTLRLRFLLRRCPSRPQPRGSSTPAHPPIDTSPARK